MITMVDCVYMRGPLVAVCEGFTEEIAETGE